MLSEQFLLMAIDDENGKVVDSPSGSLNYGLAGAILADLLLKGKIILDPEKHVLPGESQFAGDALMEETLTQMRAISKPQKLHYWIDWLVSKKMSQHFLARLVDKGVLREEEKRHWWVIPYAVYPQQDASAKFWVKLALRSAVLNGDAVEAEQLALLHLLKAARMLEVVFTKEELHLADEQIDALVKNEPIGKEVANAIEDIEASSAGAAVMLLAG